MAAATIKPLITSADRLGLTFCLAVMAHGIIVLGVTFAPEETPKTRYKNFEMILVADKSEEAPEDAKILAQANLQGGGDVLESEIPATPSPALFPDEKPKILASSSELQRPATSAADTPKIVADTEIEPAEVIEQIAVESSAADQRLAEKIDIEDKAMEPIEKIDEQQIPDENRQDRQVPEKPELPPSPSAIELMTNSLKIASLSAQIERKLQERAKRSRSKRITASTKEYKYASYMEAWRRKVERIGNLNYPEAARRDKLSGSLRLEVVLNNDGSINQITVLESSGHKALDDAAIRIVKLAAPYSPFPDNIREEVDILKIIRTWKFSNQSLSNHP